MKPQEVEFTLKGSPVAWHRTELSRSNRIDGRGVRVIKNAQDRAFQQALAIEAVAALLRWAHEHGQKWDGQGEWHLEIEWNVPDLKRRDVDNLEKNVLDALSGIVYDDDCQVVSVSKCKRLKRDTPRTIITARRVEGYLVE